MIIERLHDTLGLSKAEAEVARWILAHGNEVRNLSVDGLARAAGVSAATIVRFCKKLGTSGYREFRMAFAAEWGSGPGKVAVDANVPFEEHDSYEQVAWKLGNVAANAMNNVISNLDYECVGGVVQWMHDADVINVFTSGTSIPAALDFKTKMVRIGRQINVDQDVLIQRGYALSATRRSCNLVISHSGETEQMVSYARILKVQGCHSVAITAEPGSTLAQACDVVVLTSTPESDSFSRKLETFSSFEATHFVLDCLYAWLFQVDYGRNLAHAQVSWQTLMRMTSDSR